MYERWSLWKEMMMIIVYCELWRLQCNTFDVPAIILEHLEMVSFSFMDNEDSWLPQNKKIAHIHTCTRVYLVFPNLALFCIVWTGCFAYFICTYIHGRTKYQSNTDEHQFHSFVRYLYFFRSFGFVVHINFNSFVTFFYVYMHAYIFVFNIWNI